MKRVCVNTLLNTYIKCFNYHKLKLMIIIFKYLYTFKSIIMSKNNIIRFLEIL